MCFGESINMDNFLLQCQPGIAQGQESSAAFQAKTDQQWSVHQAEQGKTNFLTPMWMLK